jgi:hypothetical protein
MKKVKVGDRVKAPKTVNRRRLAINPDIEYVVLEVFEGGDAFTIWHRGIEAFCLLEGCSHLKGESWVVIPSKKSLLRRLINFLTFKK